MVLVKNTLLMKIFRKETDYAVRMLIYLAMQGESNFVSATALSKKLGLPMNFLRRICSRLIQAKILVTQEGKNGGVRLVVNPGKISVLQLIELFDGKPELSDCTFQKELCPNRKKCVLRKRILAIEEIISREFAAITIQSLIDDISRENP
jgi:Rrf2 family protein